MMDDLRNFFEAEIRNERHGGVAPATVFSALDSLAQAPDYVLDEWGVTREGLAELLWAIATGRVQMTTDLRELVAR